jgi:hypothetical protein
MLLCPSGFPLLVQKMYPLVRPPIQTDLEMRLIDRRLKIIRENLKHDVANLRWQCSHFEPDRLRHAAQSPLARRKIRIATAVRNNTAVAIAPAMSLAVSASDSRNFFFHPRRFHTRCNVAKLGST